MGGPDRIGRLVSFPLESQSRVCLSFLHRNHERERGTAGDGLLGLNMISATLATHS